MKRYLAAILLIFTCTVILCYAWKYIVRANLPVADPDAVGLSWDECLLNGIAYRSEDVEACFGHSLPLSDGSNADNYAKRIDMQNLKLTIGEDIYHTGVWDDIGIYTLYKNGWPIKSLWGEFTAYSPNISLQSHNGKPVWEFADHNRATVVYNGRDLRYRFRLDNTYRPYSLAGGLIYIGNLGEKYFVVYDGYRIGPQFEHILVAYCCEAMMYSVRAGGGKYLFLGKRDGKHYLVEISVAKGSKKK